MRAHPKTHGVAAQSRRCTTVLAVTFACAALTACGGSGPTRTASVSVPPASSTATATAPATRAKTAAPVPRQKARARKPAAPSNLPSSAPTKPTTRTAKRPSGAVLAAARARLRTAFATFKKCMRVSGVAIPERGAKGGVAPSARTPEFKAAAAKCRGVLIPALKALKR